MENLKDASSLVAEIVFAKVAEQHNDGNILPDIAHMIEVGNNCSNYFFAKYDGRYKTNLFAFIDSLTAYFHDLIEDYCTYNELFQIIFDVLVDRFNVDTNEATTIVTEICDKAELLNRNKIPAITYKTYIDNIINHNFINIKIIKMYDLMANISRPDKKGALIELRYIPALAKITQAICNG